MASFATVADTIRFGSDVVRLFRIALGRDPGPSELTNAAARRMAGATLLDLAASIASTDEFARRHATGKGGVEFVGSPDPDDPDREPPPALPPGTGPAEALVSLAESLWARRAVPLMPGLAPGAGADDPVAYDLWCRLYDPPAGETTAQLPSADTASPPVFAFAMSVGDSEAEAAIATIASLRAQAETDWRVVLDCRLFSEWPREVLRRERDRDSRVALHGIEGGDGGTRAVLRALAAYRTRRVGLLAPGDLLAPDALGAIGAFLSAGPALRLVTTDEDRMSAGRRVGPRLKPRASPVAENGTIGQLAVFDPALLASVGGDTPLNRASIETILQAVCRAADPDEIGHLPRILCHRTTVDGDQDAPASSAADVPAPTGGVAIVVPTRDSAGLIEACARGVLERTGRGDLRLIVVDNGSVAEDALAAIARLGADPRVEVTRDDRPFNFAALCNAAIARIEDAAFVVLMNDDVEVLDPGWLDALLTPLRDPRVAAVGATLVDEDDLIQHAGILLGPEGRATHVGRGLATGTSGYLGRFGRVTEVAAVTGACVAVRLDAYRSVGGMDERLAVAWNDIDLCLRLRAAGMHVLVTPHAVLRHREGSTRGRDDLDRRRQARFLAERDLMRARWGTALDADPFLNPNLRAPDRGDLVLSRPGPWPAADLRASVDGAMPPPTSDRPSDPAAARAPGEGAGDPR